MNDKIFNKWLTLLNLKSGDTKSNWLEKYSKKSIYGDMTPEEYNAAIQPTQPNSFDIIQFPIVKHVNSISLAGGGWIKSKKQQLKENRANKIKKLQGEKPDVVLPNDEYVQGLVSVQPLSAPTGKLFYMDYKYETAEEKRKKKQKERKEKLESLEKIDLIEFINILQLNIIRKDKLKFIEEIILKNAERKT